VLRLTDSEMDIVLAAARPLAVQDRAFDRAADSRAAATTRYGCSGDFLPPSPPGEKATAHEDQARQSGTGDGTGDRSQFASDLTHWEIHSVDVKIGCSAFDSRDQRRLRCAIVPIPTKAGL
jgi:hypothetical protein